MLEVQARKGGKETRIIFLTAMTHAAITAFLSKIIMLIDHYRNIPDLPLQWLDDIELHHIKQGTTYPVPRDDRIHIFAGTVFQLWNFTKRLRNPVNMVVIDEAGQLCLGFVALVMRTAAKDAKLVVAGDNEQLAPIFSVLYPKSDKHIFGSVLDFLMALLKPPKALDHEGSLSPSRPGTPDSSISSQISTIVQLLENFR